MENYDIKKARPDLYAPQREFEVVDVPTMTFLMADGSGDPNTDPAYAAVVEALYTTSYAVRAVAKQELGRTHTVGPLEGLWTADDMRAFTSGDAQAWQWTLMVVQPEWITAELFDTAKKRVSEKKKEIPAVDGVRLEDFPEGKSVQILHVGPYDEEAPTIAQMHDEFLPSQGFQPRGSHHEIYLSDARRTHPSRLRTILRQSVS